MATFFVFNKKMFNVILTVKEKFDINIERVKGVDMHILGEFLGYLAGVCVAVAFLPQTLKTIKDKNVSGLSLVSYIIYCTGIISWVLYGFYLKSIQMVVFNAISLIFAGIVLYMIIRYKKKK